MTEDIHSYIDHFTVNTAKCEGSDERRKLSVRKILTTLTLNILILASTCALLGACNTTAGIGQDVSATGRAVSTTADKVKSGL
jgi:predicted small secreted protein